MLRLMAIETKCRAAQLVVIPQCLVVAALAALPVTAKGQANESDVPGHVATFNLSVLAMRTDSMRISVIQGSDTTPVGQLWDRLDRFVGADGSALVRRVYRTENQLFGPHLDTAIAFDGSLRPIYKRTYSTIGADSLAFHDSVVVGWAMDSDHQRVRLRRQLPANVYDPSALDLILRSSDLDEDRVIIVPVYLASSDSVIAVRAHVSRVEDVAQRDGKVVSTWRIDVQFGDLRSRMWIDRESRALVQQAITLGPTAAMYMLR